MEYVTREGHPNEIEWVPFVMMKQLTNQSIPKALETEDVSPSTQL